EDQIDGITLVTTASVQERDPTGVFMLIRFNDDTELLESGFSKHWRGFLRLMNRLQFLPHGYVITTRGCKNGAFAGIPERYLYFLAGGQPARSDTEGGASEPDDIHADIGLAHPDIVPSLKQIPQEKRVRPVIGF